MNYSLLTLVAIVVMSYRLRTDETHLRLRTCSCACNECEQHFETLQSDFHAWQDHFCQRHSLSPSRELRPLLTVNDLHAACHCHEELRNEIQRLFDMRNETLSSLNGIIGKLHKVHRDVNIAKITGSSVGLVGGGLSVGGLILAPFTLGGSLVLTFIGSGISATGGLTTAGSVIAEKIISDDTLSKAQNLIKADRAQVDEVRRRFDLFNSISKQITAHLDDLEHDLDGVWKILKEAWYEFKQGNEGKVFLYLWNVFSIGKPLARMGSTVWDIFQVIAIGAKEFAAKSTCMMKVLGTTIGRFADGLFLFFGILIDAYTLVSTIKDMKKGSLSEKALKLQKKVDTLQEEQTLWHELFLKEH